MHPYLPFIAIAIMIAVTAAVTVSASTEMKKGCIRSGNNGDNGGGSSGSTGIIDVNNNSGRSDGIQQ